MQVFLLGEAVGHPRDIVAHHSRQRVAFAPASKARRQQFRKAAKLVKQRPNDSASLVLHAHHPVMAINPLVEKLLELGLERGHFRTARHQRARRLTDVVHRADSQLAKSIQGVAHHVANLPVDEITNDPGAE